MTILLDGRASADKLLNEVAARVENLQSQGVQPKLVVIIVGEDPASAVYVRHKVKACKRVGILSERLSYPADLTQAELLQKIDDLNRDDSVHGLIVQLPLPAHIATPEIIRAIDPLKDVDGFHAYNMGKMLLSQEFEDLAPCTPKGIIRLMEDHQIDPVGMDAVIIGKSNIVGKPIGVMLLNRGATVTVCHRQTKDLARYTRDADLVVVAVGKPGLLTADMVKQNVVVIDVGINRLEDGRLVGDVDFDAVKEKAAAITPVPGGVGPMTVACLLENTLRAAERRLQPTS